nr:DUF3558 domain-containing protein [Corynebacterium diphtheriae]CAB0883206.1 hypothetical protein FRC0402_01582 [Corynebacterium diphtheriae]
MSFLNQGGYNLMRHLIRGKHAQSHSKPAVLFALLAALTLAGCEGSSPSSSAQRTSTSLNPESAEATFFNPCEVLSAEDFAEMGLVRTKDPIEYDKNKPFTLDCAFVRPGKTTIDGYYVISTDTRTVEGIAPNVRFIDEKFPVEVLGSYSYERIHGMFKADCEAAIATPTGRLAVSASSLVTEKTAEEFCIEANQILFDVNNKKGE